jgi:hypothetical protein
LNRLIQDGIIQNPDSRRLIQDAIRATASKRRAIGACTLDLHPIAIAVEEIQDETLYGIDNSQSYSRLLSSIRVARTEWNNRKGAGEVRWD